VAVPNSKELLLLTLVTFFVSIFFVFITREYLDISIYVLVLFSDAFLCFFLWKMAARQAPNDRWKTGICAHGIALVTAFGCIISFSGSGYSFFGVYMITVGFFHLSEYILTALYNASRLSIDSFLINHSAQYVIALACSVLEYWVEYYAISWIKEYAIISFFGLLVVIAGEGLRKAAMITARSNFTHTVQYYRRPNHVLVTHGVYSVSRHPSYMGFFYWSIGTQILLCNPVCLVGFAAASWRFFSDRIYDEEELLLEFFKDEYVDYKKQVGVGIPFIKGYPVPTA
jgi:protein-S-isoprenylcysteine O-methyltransferase